MILTPAILYNIDKESVRIVPFYDGEIEYFGGHHLRYAFPAIFCLIFVLVIPPVVLIMYPSTYKILAFFKINESVLITMVANFLPLGRLKPLLDSFQSCFKDNMRFFAALYFVYRLAILAASIFAVNPGQMYIICSVIFISILLFHALAQPYQVMWHNVIDMFIFGSLAVISCLTLYNVTQIFEARKKIVVDGVVSTQLAIGIVPLVYMAGYVIVTMLRSLYRKCKS